MQVKISRFGEDHIWICVSWEGWGETTLSLNRGEFGQLRDALVQFRTQLQTSEHKGKTAEGHRP